MAYLNITDNAVQATLEHFTLEDLGASQLGLKEESSLYRLKESLSEGLLSEYPYSAIKDSYFKIEEKNCVQNAINGILIRVTVASRQYDVGDRYFIPTPSVLQEACSKEAFSSFLGRVSEGDRSFSDGEWGVVTGVGEGEKEGTLFLSVFNSEGQFLRTFEKSNFSYSDSFSNQARSERASREGVGSPISSLSFTSLTEKGLEILIEQGVSEEVARTSKGFLFLRNELSEDLKQIESIIFLDGKEFTIPFTELKGWGSREGGLASALFAKLSLQNSMEEFARKNFSKLRA